MHLILLLGVLSTAYLGVVRGCAIAPSEAEQQLSGILLEGMKMTKEETNNVGPQAIAEAKANEEMFSIPDRDVDSKGVSFAETTDDELKYQEHLFELQEIPGVIKRVGLSLFLRPAESLIPVTVVVKARDIGSTDWYDVASAEFDSPRRTEPMRIEIGLEHFKRWADSPTASVVLKVECHSEDGDLIVYDGDDNSRGRKMSLGVLYTDPPMRVKRSTANLCKEDGTDEECCIATKEIQVDKQFLNVISPSTLVFSYCKGTCHKHTSFQPLLTNVSTKAFADAHGHPKCCHAVRAGHLDILFLRRPGEVDSERVFNVNAIECICY